MKTGSADEIIVSIVAILIGGAWTVEFVKGIFQRKKIKASSDYDQAQAASVLVATANTLVGPLTIRLTAAEAQAESLRSELEQARTQLQDTMAELNQARNELRIEREENKRVTTENRQLRRLLANGSTT